MLTNRKVIIAEDSEADRFLMSKYLQYFGFEFECFCNGQELIKNLKNYPSSLILLDIELPYLNGMEAAAIIKRDFNTEERTYTLLGITSHNDPKKLKEIKESGIDDFLIKPVSRKTLGKKLEQYFESVQVLPDKKFPGEKSCGNNERVYSLKALLEEDDEFVKSILQIFVESTISSLEELKKALLENNLSFIKLTAHRMKPHFTLLQMHQTAAQLNEVESLATDAGNKEKIEHLIENIDLIASLAVSQIKSDLENNLVKV